MDENFLQKLYHELLEPLGDVPDELKTEYKSNNRNELDDYWLKDTLTPYGIEIKEWIELQIEHELPKNSELDRQVLKQLIDDLLADDYKRTFSNIVIFSVIPKVKKYPLIKDYNFSYEPHLKDYAEKVFHYLRFIDSYLFSIEELGEFKDGRFIYMIKDKHKKRLNYLKRVVIENENYINKSEEQDIAYELTYKDNEIRIKGALKPLHKLTDNSQGQKLFEELWEHKGSKVLKQGLIARGVRFSRSFNSLIKDMKLVNDYGNLFVPNKGQDSAILYHIITHKQLKEENLDYLSPEALTKLMKKQT